MMTEQEYPDDPLKPDEIKQIRAVLEREARVKWLASWLRTVATWVAAIVAGWFAFKAFLVDMVSGK